MYCTRPEHTNDFVEVVRFPLYQLYVTSYFLLFYLRNSYLHFGIYFYQNVFLYQRIVEQEVAWIQCLTKKVAASSLSSMLFSYNQLAHLIFPWFKIFTSLFLFSFNAVLRKLIILHIFNCLSWISVKWNICFILFSFFNKLEIQELSCQYGVLTIEVQETNNRRALEIFFVIWFQYLISNRWKTWTPGLQLIYTVIRYNFRLIRSQNRLIMTQNKFSQFKTYPILHLNVLFEESCSLTEFGLG